jgi:hypothetical protein
MFNAVAGTTCQIAADSSTNAMGNFTLSLGPVPANDNFTNRLVISGTNVASSSATFGASLEAGEEQTLPGGANSIWWEWTAPADGLARVAVAAAETGAKPHLEAFPASDGPPLPSVPDWPWLPAVVVPSLDLAATAGEAYYFRVTTAGGSSTNVTLTLAFAPQPPLSGEWTAGQFPWVRGGQALWFVQTNVFHDPPDALSCGPLEAGQAAWVQTSFLGPGALKFWWKLSATPTLDRLSVSVLTARIDGGALVQSNYLTGERDWAMCSLSLANRTNVVRWTYSRDSTRRPGPSGPNAAWLDSVAFEPRAPQPWSFSAPRMEPDGSFGVSLRLEAQRQYCFQVSTDLVHWIDLTNFFCRSNASLRYRPRLDTNAPALYLRGFILWP